MALRTIRLAAVGFGLLVILGAGFGGRAEAATAPLCIGKGGAFVVCGQPGQGVVLPPTSTTRPPVSRLVPTPTPVTTPATLPISVRPVRAPAPFSSVPADSTTVIVWGSIGAALLFVPLIGLLAVTSLHLRLPLRRSRRLLST